MSTRIVALREKHGLSLSRLADLAGISKSSLHEIENGEHPRPSAANLWAIAEALGTTFEYLLVGEEPAQPERTDSIPPSLEAFARKKRIPLEDKLGLALIQHQGRQPEKPEDWAFLYEVIRRCC